MFAISSAPRGALPQSNASVTGVQNAQLRKPAEVKSLFFALSFGSCCLLLISIRHVLLKTIDPKFAQHRLCGQNFSEGSKKDNNDWLKTFHCGSFFVRFGAGPGVVCRICTSNWASCAGDTCRYRVLKSNMKAYDAYDKYIDWKGKKQFQMVG